MKTRFLSDWRKVSRVDYAFDFHSPEMTSEISAAMADQIVCHSSCKIKREFKAKEIVGYNMGTSNRTQTLTIGKKDNLQVQLYNKSDEITEKSQKTWMYKLWKQVGLDTPENGDVWRIELRYGRNYLKERGIDTFEQLEQSRESLLSEALKTRRLTDKTRDKNRRRWPVHPMWHQAIDMAGNSSVMLNLRNHQEQAADVIIGKIEQDIKAALRRYSVLETGGDTYDKSTVAKLYLKIMKTIDEDYNHEQKMEEYGEKYKYVHEPL